MSEYVGDTAQKATIQQVTITLGTSKNVLFPGPNHLLTTGADDLTPNTHYKILTKLLSVHLQNVISTLVATDQTGYIKNRYFG